MYQENVNQYIITEEYAKLNREAKDDVSKADKP